MKTGHEAHASLTEEILLAVGARPDTRIWRQVTGKFLTMGRRDVVNVGIKGQADLSGLLSCGRRLEVEVKTGSGRRTTEQRTWARVMEQFGAVYCVARTVEDAVERIEEHARGCVVCRSRARDGTVEGSHDGAEGINRDGC